MKPTFRDRRAVRSALGAALGLAAVLRSETMAFAPPAISPTSTPPSSAHAAAPFSSGNAEAAPFHRSRDRSRSTNNPSPSPPVPSSGGGRDASSSALSMFADFFDPGEGDWLLRKNLNFVVFGIISSVYLVSFNGLGLFRVVDDAGGEIGISGTLGEIERWDPGPHVVKNPLFPTTSVRKVSTKTELPEERSNFVPTEEGPTVEPDTTVLIRPAGSPDRAPEPYRSVGPELRDEGRRHPRGRLVRPSGV